MPKAPSKPAQLKSNLAPLLLPELEKTRRIIASLFPDLAAAL